MPSNSGVISQVTFAVPSIGAIKFRQCIFHLYLLKGNPFPDGCDGCNNSGILLIGGLGWVGVGWVRLTPSRAMKLNSLVSMGVLGKKRTGKKICIAMLANIK